MSYKDTRHKYYEIHKKQIREQQKQYRQYHKEEISKYNKQYLESHKEKIKQQIMKSMKLYFKTTSRYIGLGTCTKCLKQGSYFEQQSWYKNHKIGRTYTSCMHTVWKNGKSTWHQCYLGVITQ